MVGFLTLPGSLISLVSSTATTPYQPQNDTPLAQGGSRSPKFANNQAINPAQITQLQEQSKAQHLALKAAGWHQTNAPEPNPHLLELDPSYLDSGEKERVRLLTPLCRARAVGDAELLLVFTSLVRPVTLIAAAN